MVGFVDVHRSRRVALAILLLGVAACTGESERPLFKLLSAAETGITFANTITTDDSLNVQTDVYVYNGAGVAVGDIDNDGLSDIFFTGNMVSSRLYLNKGAMRFDDITERAGVDDAAMGHGRDDGGHQCRRVPRHLRLRVRSRVDERGTAGESALRQQREPHVHGGGGTVRDRRHGLHHARRLPRLRQRRVPRPVSAQQLAQGFRAAALTSHPSGARGTTPGSYNQLYRNTCRDGKPGTFTNVSQAAGILRTAGFGLGVVVADLNSDGWPDIYVSNDVQPNDVLYVNNGDGTFTDKAARWLKHASFAGMGVDIADFNNDGWPDILQVDMLPRDLDARKRMSGFTSYGDAHGVAQARISR